jgi:hypothetical protein
MPKKINTRRPRKNGKALVQALTALGERKEEFPGQVSGTMTYPVTVRFTVTGSAPNLVVTRGNVLNLLVCAVSTTSVARIWGSCKINKLKIWQATQATAPTSSFTGVQLEWLSEQGPDRVMQDTGNIMRPAHISSRPPNTSFASFWNLSGSNESVNLFKLSAQPFGGTSGTGTPLLIGSIVEIHMTVTNLDDETPVLTTVVAATQGQVYVRSLDGVFGNYVPVSYLTI